VKERIGAESAKVLKEMFRSQGCWLFRLQLWEAYHRANRSETADAEQHLGSQSYHNRVAHLGSSPQYSAAPSMRTDREGCGSVSIADLG
jgi:hypothetical protein